MSVKLETKQVIELDSGVPLNEAVMRLLEQAKSAAAEVDDCSTAIVVLVREEGMALGGVAGTPRGLNMLRAVLPLKIEALLNAADQYVDERRACEKTGH